MCCSPCRPASGDGSFLARPKAARGGPPSTRAPMYVRTLAPYLRRVSGFELRGRAHSSKHRLLW
eukprot:365930-Chlamydomonas_euryale.AAC.13